MEILTSNLPIAAPSNNPLRQPPHHTFPLRLRPGRDPDGGRDKITKDAVARIATVAGSKPRLSRTRIKTVAETKLRLSRDENHEVARPPHTVDAISSSASPRRRRHPKIAFHTLSPPSGARPRADGCWSLVGLAGVLAGSGFFVFLFLVSFLNR